VKFGCAKVLLLISEQNPRALFPWLDRFVEPLKADNQIFKWQAILIVANRINFGKATH
jgi:hypothetical protein